MTHIKNVRSELINKPHIGVGDLPTTPDPLITTNQQKIFKI